jgi:outer membrane protein assembly factor BamB
MELRLTLIVRPSLARIAGSRRARLFVIAAVTAVAALGLATPAAAAAPRTAAAAPRTAAVKTTTTLVASAKRTTYDTVVRFTAHVQAAGRTPTGKLAFTDKRNGSVLDVAVLRKGAATFSTAALAPGQRSIVAVYVGTSTFGRSVSGAAGVAVRGVDDATAQQIDTSHDGDQSVGALRVGALARKWRASLNVLPGSLTYPVIAGGRVFVVGAHSENKSYSTDTLYALNDRTGRTDWSVTVPSLYPLGLTYDGRSIFYLNDSGGLTAYDAATGHKRWFVQMPEEDDFTGAPTAFDGVVYLDGSGQAGLVYALTEAHGLLLWGDEVQNGDGSSPAVGDGAVYVSYLCQQDYRISLDGLPVWNHAAGCEGGGGSTPVLHGRFVYAEGSPGVDSPLVLSAATGKTAGHFSGDTIPAFDATNMYILQGGALVATAPAGGPTRWKFSGRALVTAPVVSQGVVFAGARSGKVLGVSTSGHQVWSGNAGAAMAPGTSSGLAIGAGLLVVPAGHYLTAFGD